MCEASAYLINESGEEELWLADVDKVELMPEGGLRMVTIYGEQKTFPGRIKSMSLVDHRLILTKD